MSWQAALITKLKATSTVFNLTGDQIYAEQIPRAVVFPSIRFYLVSKTPVSTKESATNTDEVYVQVEVADADYAAAINLQKALVTALDRASFGVVKLSRLVRETEGFDPDDGFHIVGGEYQFWTTR